jgi:galactose-1-phosphate uridylyltransferase
MGGLKFSKKALKFNILTPEIGFQGEEQLVEVRVDPLTGWRARINMMRRMRIKQVSQLQLEPFGKKDFLQECPFCPGNIERKTPMFPEDIVDGGRLKMGEATLFPNRYGFSEHHAVVVLTRKHYVPIGEFKAQSLHDAIRLSLQFLQRLSHRSKVLYAWINWNYMPPSGASVIHPHLQVTAERSSSWALKELLKKSLMYYRRRKRGYWLQLIETERRLRERFIGEDNYTVWLSSYAPRGNNEIIALQPSISSLGEMEEEHVRSLSEGVSLLLKAYDGIGVNSFNMSTYSDEFHSKSKHFTLQFRFISRPRLVSYYTNDEGFMEILQLEPVIEQTPETTAKLLKPFFTGLQ